MHINFVPLPFALCYFLPRVVYQVLCLIFSTFSDKILRENIRLFDISFIYNLIDWPPFCCINFFSSFISFNVVNILARCLFFYDFVFLSFLISIETDSSTLSSSDTAKWSCIESIFISSDYVSSFICFIS